MTTTVALVARDSATMFRRNFKHMLRYPTLVMFVVVIPVVIMLLFVYVFGGTLAAGLPGVSGTRGDYANYLLPGILIFAIAGGGQMTAISVAMDMTEGIVARFKTMSIGKSAVLAGHVLGTMLQTMIGVFAVLAVALLIGARPSANALEWVAAIGVLMLCALAITWFCVACGCVAKSVESASNLPMPLILLPFLGSGFTPTESMPTVVRWFADYQPFTPITETVRGLLLGDAIGSSGVVAVAWCVAITLASYIWAMSLYDRSSTRQRGT